VFCLSLIKFAHSLFYAGESDQTNPGTIKSSYLCTEIDYSSPAEMAVCNLASLALPSFVINGEYDFKKLHDVTKVVALKLFTWVAGLGAQSGKE